MDKICNMEMCTGCGACSEVCPNQCITMREIDNLGTVKPTIDNIHCINCGACREVCHVNCFNEAELKYPIKAYAARSADLNIRSLGASGGIASSFYLDSLQNNGFVMATCYDRLKGVYYRILNYKWDIEWARDSKYAFSSMEGVFIEYAKRLRSQQKCLFIGLPCQVAALKCFLTFIKAKLDDIIFVELVCSGVPNYKLLNEHLEHIEKKKGKRIDKVLFRTPNSSYNFTCYSQGKKIWEKGMQEDDRYFRGFSISLFLRENCYLCKYARKERIADITIGDYSGLGRAVPFEGDKQQMSLVLCNTNRGLDYWRGICSRVCIEKHERPVEEPICADNNPRLREAAEKSSRYHIFMRNYEAGIGFEDACDIAMGDLFKEYYSKIAFIYVKKFISKHLSPNTKEKIGKLFRK